MKKHHVKSARRSFWFTGIRVIFLSGWFFITASVKAQPAETKYGIFYAITGNGAKDTSWLFGTYHLVNSGYLDNVSQVKEKFNTSKVLVVETVIDSSKLMAAQAMGMLQNKTLSSMLDKAFADSLDKELTETVGVGIAALDQLKPVNVAITLSLVHVMKNNSEILQQYSGAPLDLYFAKQAAAQNKTIEPLETLEEQMDLLFNKLSEEEQVAQLKAFLRHKTTMVQLGDDLLQSWFSHDLERMQDIYNKTAAIFGEADYLLKDRNKAWMKALPSMINRESHFIAVGALHLAGNDGLLAQLKSLGYRITPIKL